jgi:hypothetical protein
MTLPFAVLGLLIRAAVGTGGGTGVPRSGLPFRQV